MPATALSNVARLWAPPFLTKPVAGAGNTESNSLPAPTVRKVLTPANTYVIALW